MDKWERDMIAGVNSNAEIRELERKLKAISARRKRKGVPFWRRRKSKK